LRAQHMHAFWCPEYVVISSPASRTGGVRPCNLGRTARAVAGHPARHGRRYGVWLGQYGRRYGVWFAQYGRQYAVWLTQYGRRYGVWFTQYGRRYGVWLRQYGRQYSVVDRNDAVLTQH
jgi:hypothetical protein